MITFDEAYFSDEFIQDPIGPLAELRRRGSIHRSEILHAWVVLGWHDSRTVLGSRGIGQGDRLAGYVTNLSPHDASRLHPISNHMDRAISFLDPPDHTAERAAAAQILNAGLGRRIEPALQATLHECLDELAERESFDAIEDFALPLTVTMISALLGVRYEDRDRFVGWVERIFAYLGSPMTDPLWAQDCKDAYGSLGEYVGELFAEARLRPDRDASTLIGLLVGPWAGHELTSDDLMGMVVGMVQGGFETTTTLISNAIAMLLQNPEERTRVQADTSLTPMAIEEVLRMAPSLKMGARQAHEDVELSGATVRAGDNVVPVLIAANRDPAVFADPDCFDITRQPNPHLSFGFGTHFCLGAPLARTQARVAVDALFRRFPDMILATDELAWRPSALLRRRVAVPIRTYDRAWS